MIRVEVLRQLSLYLKVASACLVAGMLIHIIGLASPYWVSESGVLHVGLWQGCVSGFCVATDSDLGWLNAVKFAELVSLFFLAGSFVLLFFFQTTSRRLYLILSTALSFIAGVFILLGVIVYAAESDSGDLSWAFGVEVVAALVAVAAGVFSLLEMKSGRSGYLPT